MARELDVDEGLIERVLMQLQQRGYIEKDSMDDCSEGCGCCSRKSSCCSDKHNIEINIWKITEKGRKPLKCNIYKIVRTAINR